MKPPGLSIFAGGRGDLIIISVSSMVIGMLRLSMSSQGQLKSFSLSRFPPPPPIKLLLLLKVELNFLTTLSISSSNPVLYTSITEIAHT